MKKILKLALSALMALSLAACTSSPTPSGASIPDASTADQPETVTVSSLNAAGETIQVVVPYQPERVAVFNLAVLDMMDVWDLGEHIVGIPKASKVNYLSGYFEDESIINLGTLKEVDMEALMSAEPNLIFISGRLGDQYDELSKIAPVVYTDSGHKTGYMKTTKENIHTIASIFGMKDNGTEVIDNFSQRIETLTETAKDKTAVIGMVTSSSLNTLGNGTRGSLIGHELGFENLADDVDATHGNESSFELLLQLNPDYIFIIDRDRAIGTEGAQLAQQVMENELVQKTQAYQQKTIVYLTPEVWYLVEGGITSTDLMLRDLEKALIP